VALQEIVLATILASYGMFKCGMKMVRDIIIDNIIRYMKDDPNVIFLTGDLGFGSVDKIQKYFP